MVLPPFRISYMPPPLTRLYPSTTTRLRKIPLNTLRRPPFKGPADTDIIRLRCGNCATEFAPDWTRRLPEIGPVERDGMVHVPATFNVPCPKCASKNRLQFPETEDLGVLDLYGDEAFRDLPANLFSCVYAFVALLEPLRSHFSNIVDQAKLAIRPKDDPASWPFHCMDLRDERWRKRHGVTQSIGEINAIISNCASALSMGEGQRRICATFVICEKPKSTSLRCAIQEETLAAAMYLLTESMTRRGFTPRFIVEAQTDSHATNSIDPLVERASRGLFTDLGYLYSCRCKNVGVATTAQKASTPELVAADLVAYVVARTLYRRQIGRPSEIDPTLFGDIQWGTMFLTQFGSVPSRGFPESWYQTCWQMETSDLSPGHQREDASG